MPGRSRQVSLSALAAKTALAETVIDDAASAPAVVSPPEPDVIQAASAPSAPRPAEPRGPRRRRNSPAHPAPGEWVRYDEYERKEARLRPDQYGRLSTTSRALNRVRKGTGERITENTLIRIAIDLLLAREQDLIGVTEGELRKSLGL